jgi:branched-chain amino acid transport system ATP-binding protein
MAATPAPQGEPIPAAPAATPVLDVQHLTSGYNELPVVRDLSLKVEAGEIVALLGPNGAGKSTTLLSIAGVVPPMSGTISMQGQPLAGPLHRRARRGMALITEGRSVFMGLSVATNLRLGRGDTARALESFPELRPLMDRRAGLLSGGEQQILTLARAVSGDSVLLLVDELSLGLAPLIVQRLLREVRVIADRGVGVLLVEQHARQVLPIADRGYVMRRGKIVLSDTGSGLLDRLDEIEQSYLGMGPLEDESE